MQAMKLFINRSMTYSELGTFGFFFCILLFSCSSPSPQNKEFIQADYYIRYLETERQLRAEVNYQSGPNKEQLKPKEFSSVFFQGGAMNSRDLGKQGIRYKSERNGGYPANFTFKYEDDAEKEHDHFIEMAPIESFKINDNLSLEKGTKLKWEGGPLTKDQDLILMFTDKDTKAAVVNLKGPTKGSSVIIPANQLGGLAKGQASLYLVKKQRVISEDDNHYTKTDIEYYTSTIQLNIVD